MGNGCSKIKADLFDAIDVNDDGKINSEDIKWIIEYAGARIIIVIGQARQHVETLLKFLTLVSTLLKSEAVRNNTSIKQNEVDKLLTIVSDASTALQHIDALISDVITKKNLEAQIKKLVTSVIAKQLNLDVETVMTMTQYATTLFGYLTQMQVHKDVAGIDENDLAALTIFLDTSSKLQEIITQANTPKLESATLAVDTAHNSVSESSNLSTAILPPLSESSAQVEVSNTTPDSSQLEEQVSLEKSKEDNLAADTNNSTTGDSDEALNSNPQKITLNSPHNRKTTLSETNETNDMGSETLPRDSSLTMTLGGSHGSLVNLDDNDVLRKSPSMFVRKVDVTVAGATTPKNSDSTPTNKVALT